MLKINLLLLILGMPNELVTSNPENIMALDTELQICMFRCTTLITVMITIHVLQSLVRYI